MKSQISPSDRANLASEIAALAEAPTADLKSRSRVLFGAEPPPRISRDLLTRALAYRMHSEALPRGQDWSDTKCSNPIASRTGCTARIEERSYSRPKGGLHMGFTADPEGLGMHGETL
jgi:hypothetical protein